MCKKIFELMPLVVDSSSSRSSSLQVKLLKHALPFITKDYLSAGIWVSSSSSSDSDAHTHTRTLKATTTTTTAIVHYRHRLKNADLAANGLCRSKCDCLCFAGGRGNN
ncbi:uncharacterized protein LOC108599005 [Drosophila busckii]|uniref:uncharacterized protein LOC108599005 n=1 Tax=Drosophila busckii TaxID=30019 RepID=UPI0014331835|nr:uncharacterized protein LOC108599005 [Drosophila busckii]